ncbi:universal stress protein [Saliphagus sp. GCM10025334]
MAITFDGPILVPAADPDDAERTARALAPRIGPENTVLVVHVVEKAGGAPDKAPLEARREFADDVFSRARGPLEETGANVETEVLYGTDVVDAIFEAADDGGADGVAFVPRKGNRLVEMVSGDTSRRLIREATLPVLVLPVEE